MGKKKNKKIVKAANKLIAAISDITSSYNLVLSKNLQAKILKLKRLLNEDTDPVLFKDMVKDFNSIPMPTITPKVYKYSPIVPIEEDESTLPKQCKECKGTGKVLESYNDGMGQRDVDLFPCGKCSGTGLINL